MDSSSIYTAPDKISDDKLTHSIFECTSDIGQLKYIIQTNFNVLQGYHLLLLRSYAVRGLKNNVELLYNKLLEENIPIDKPTYDALAEMHGLKADLRSFDELLDTIKASDSARPDATTYGRMMRGLALRGVGQLRNIALIFDKMMRDNITPTSTMYAIAIEGFSEIGDTAGVRTLYKQAKQDSNIRLDRDIFFALLKGCSKSADVELYERVKPDMSVNGVPMDGAIALQVLLTYIRFGDVDKSEDMFSEVVACNVEPGQWLMELLLLYAQQGMIEKVCDLYEQLEMSLVCKDQIVFRKILECVFKFRQESYLERVLMLGNMNEYVFHSMLRKFLEERRMEEFEKYYPVFEKAKIRYENTYK